jgi:leucyl aminopeptidase (aminopeptidase T)
VVIYDAEHALIAETVADAAVVAKAEVMRFVLDDLGPRPHAGLHPKIEEALEGAQASVMIVSFLAGELRMRAQVVELAERRGLRHAHMPGVGRQSMVEGFSVDPDRIAEKGRALAMRLRPGSRITVKNAAGTDLVIKLAPQCKWLEIGCVVAAGRAANLPGGELVTSPESVDGVCVADGTIGDADGTYARRLRETPLTFRFTHSRVQAVECARDPGFARAIKTRTTEVANLDRVGLVQFGLNIGLREPIGDLPTDQKLPGLHLSLGDTLRQKTNAQWTSKSWIAVALTSCDVDIDKTAVLRAGRYVV